MRKNKSFFESVWYALKGMKEAFKTEKNFRTYIFIAIVFATVNFVCGVSFVQHIIFMAVVGGVFSAEYINTAIEKLCDIYTKEYMDEIRIIKDIAASGVLAWGFVFFSMEGLYVAKTIYERLICQ